MPLATLSRGLTMTAAALAASAAVCSAPALAATGRDMATSQPQTRASITVIAPRERQTGRDEATGAPIQTLTAQSLVYIDDLNLHTEAGRDMLHKRVRDAAQSSCKWLDQVYPLSMKFQTDSQCISQAVARAKDQVNAAIGRAA